jgi:hypothetical protein
MFGVYSVRYIMHARLGSTTYRRDKLGDSSCILFLRRYSRRNAAGMRISITTLCCLVAVGGILLWLNLRTPEWLEEYGLSTSRPPEGLDPVTEFLFFRGWPFTPCGYCDVNLAGWHPDRSNGDVQLAALADVLSFFLVLAVTGVVCEWCCRFWKTR